MQPIFLIGYMCSGKTTLGAALAQALSESRPMLFIDLDQAIEQEQGMSVRQIFALKGESAFRALEADALRRVSKMQDVVIACGGGTPCQPGAMEQINAHGISVYLEADVGTLARRLLEGAAQRPLVAHIRDRDDMEQYVAQMLKGREHFYLMAKHRFDSNKLESEEEINDSVKKLIRTIL